MRRNLISLLVTSALILPGSLAIVGCDETISHEETVKQRSDGTSVKHEETVKQKDDGTVVKEESKKVDNTPDNDGR
jgi:hypothetical protein